MGKDNCCPNGCPPVKCGGCKENIFLPDFVSEILNKNKKGGDSD